MPSPSPPRRIRPKLVTDEHHRPVAVLIDYEDWLEIQQRLGLADDEPAPPLNFDQLLHETRGLWTQGDGLDFQRRLRDEWTRPWDPEAHEGS